MIANWLRYEISFVPNINENSKQLSNQPNSGGKVSVYDRLHNRAMLKNHQKAVIQAAQAQGSQSSKRPNGSVTQSATSQSQMAGRFLH